MRRIFVSAILLVFAAGSLHAAGPSEVAGGDRTFWPTPIHSTESFDLASRAELLAFGKALADSEQLDDQALQQRLQIKSFDHASVEHIRAIYWQRLTTNYMLAAAHCDNQQLFCAPVHNQSDFKRAAIAFTAPPQADYRAWFDQASAFHRIYLDELLRLAALFPKVNSEVETFSAQEIDGNGLGDREFLLSFDDGPTRAGGSTDAMLQILRSLHLNATFFTLGGSLQARLQQTSPAAVAATYQGMCVGAHGWEHRSHSTWPAWQDSVTRSIALVHDNLPDSYVPLFRPPYGQRRPDSGAFFAQHGLHVALWNIDSQDWNAKVDADQVKQRVLSLMLLWRHGIILFHDIHTKAQVAVPWLQSQLHDTDVQWLDCHRFSAGA
ncbi:polysaccharide deacetylase family protein [Dyella nitratireducens]|uniref:Polysaccharide deacetylase n=1 Tax=Dyella nitratireducens TaxID=1849580 RepID=A0ABQ1GPP3_9GAMM|nr:polysaccharide deacetylase family protein [Dyella nitratireducens]GGA47574.1 polysaccharide deacetylase [Dyella nitratireducens]GLQ42431.1 polysaccharide deacetylase [Dyella nitratireducens]